MQSSMGAKSNTTVKVPSKEHRRAGLALVYDTLVYDTLV